MNTSIVVPALSAGGLVALVSLVLSLVLMYFPGINKWFAGKTSEIKKAVFLGTAVVIGALWFAMGFLNLPPEWGIVVTPVNFSTFVSAVIGIAFGAGGVQGLYKLLYEPDAVTEVKALRDGAFLEQK
jgi:uncharacterized membrane protein